MRKTRSLSIASLVVSAALVVSANAPARPDGAGTGPTAARSTESSADERALRAIFDGMTDAWARCDGVAFAASFSPDARFVNIEGTALAGREEIARHHAALFAGPYKGTRATIAATDVRFIRPDIAIVAVSGAVIPPGATEAEARAAVAQAPFVVTCTLARGANGWMIESFQNTMKPPPVPPPGKP